VVSLLVSSVVVVVMVVMVVKMEPGRVKLKWQCEAWAPPVRCFEPPHKKTARALAADARCLLRDIARHRVA